MFKINLKILIVYIFINSCNIFANDEIIFNVLDTNGLFNKKLLFNYKKMNFAESPVSLNCISDTDDVILYALKRKFLPTETNKFPDMEGDESYILRIFKHKNIVKDNIEFNIYKPVYSTWFTQYLYVYITNLNTKEYSDEMLPFLNKNNLKLFYLELENDEMTAYSSKQASLAMNQLSEMAAGVARQAKLQQTIEHQNILKSYSLQDLDLFEIPDDVLLNYIYNISKNDTDTILRIMQSIAIAIEHLHESKIAHGDIKLTNLFYKNDQVLLSGFERYSDVKLKKFTFYNNIYHAPEIRYPFGVDKKWEYTNATSEGDIYSLGMVFAVILQIFCPEELDFVNKLSIIKNKMISEEQFLNFTEQQQATSLLFNNQPDSTITYYIPRNYIYSIIVAVLSIPNKMKSLTAFLFSNESETHNINCIVTSLINIINSCHNENPSDRPTATTIKIELNKIIDNSL